MLPICVGLDGAGRAAQELLAAIAELHDNHIRDCGESLYLAYEAGSYSKAGPLPRPRPRRLPPHPRHVAHSYDPLQPASEATSRSHHSHGPDSER